MRVEWRAWGAWEIHLANPAWVFDRLAEILSQRTGGGEPWYPLAADIEIRVYAGAERWVWRQVEAEALLRQWARERC